MFQLSDVDVISLRRQLIEFIQKGSLGISVVNALLPGGKPHLYEKSLWDYKLIVPSVEHDRKLTEKERHEYDCKMAEIVKDVVAFYNSYGGYLLVGVSDRPREVKGFDLPFNVGNLIKKVNAATRHDVDCHYATHDVNLDGSTKRLGLLFIPQRPDEKEPAQFLRDAPAKEPGKVAYRRHQIYFRQGDECKCAETAADYSFLCSQDRRRLLAWIQAPGRAVSNNLGARDPGFIKFVGREEYLRELWKWLCDKFSPVKLLAGLGGVGKTTLAREFAEDVIRNSPIGLENLIWLSAKRKFYAAATGKYILIQKIDFDDVDSLLRAILMELGHPAEMLNPEWAREELLEEVIKTLQIMPSLLMIDDIDSLNPDEQHEAFHTIIQVIGATMGSCPVPSRALLTARLDLGASPAQLLRIRGLEKNDFVEYVMLTAKNMELPWAIGAGSRLMSRFHQVTDGSPTFASSILLLMQMGQQLENALTSWQGSDGEEVRKFAFQKELENLTDSQARTLYAACLLGETSLAELQAVLNSHESSLRDDIGELRKYHLIALGSEIPGSGFRLIVPSGIQLMADLMSKRVRDPKSIEAKCISAKKRGPKLRHQDPRVARTVIALWQQNKPDEAFHTVSQADKEDDPDLKCLLANALLRLNSPNAKQADIEFGKAYKLGCRRTELTRLWVKAKTILKDWQGVIEITALPNRESPFVDDLFYRGNSYLELSEIALSSGNLDGAATHCLTGAREIDAAFKDDRAAGRVDELSEMRTQLCERYVWAKDSLHRSPDDHLYVWLACCDVFKCFVRRRELIELGLNRLKSWWVAVEKRPQQHKNSLRQLQAQVSTLDFMAMALSKHKNIDPALLEQVRETEKWCGERLEEYSYLTTQS